MTETLLERSARYIDDGVYEGPEANNPMATSFHEVADAGDLRLACQLAEWAAQAAPDDAGVHAQRAEVYRRRREAETSLMSRGIFGTAASVSGEGLGLGGDRR